MTIQSQGLVQQTNRFREIALNGDNANPTLSWTPIPGKTTVGGDCNDSDFNIRPGVVENCDAVDNNCNGILIEGECPGSNADVAATCYSTSSQNVLTGEFYFNYGSVSSALNPASRASVTVGQPAVGTSFGTDVNAGYGFWTRFLLAPAAPVATATEGDLPDRVQVTWTPEPLSPEAVSFNVYRDGSLLASVGNEVRSFLDFNVLAGQFYTYEVAGVNQFGEGYRGSSLGFLNPNGVVTGQVKSFSGNPVVGAVVKLSPTIGTALEFEGKSTAFAEYKPAIFPTDEFTVSCWVKQGDGNDDAGIFDLGSSIGKNWWLHTLPSGATKGVKFGIGAGVATEITHEYPAATASDWHYVAATYNGSALLLYVDGELAGTDVGDIEADSSLFFLGKHDGAGGFFTGKIDELRVFNRQLAQTEIQTVMNQTVSASTSGLKIYWKFDEGVGSKGFDLAAGKTKIYLCGPTWTSDKPNVVNAGTTNQVGFYKIEGVNYAAGTTFTAEPFKNFYFNQSLEFNAANESSADLTDFDLPDSSTVEITIKNFDFSANQVILSKNGHFELGLNAGNVQLKMGGTTHDFGALDMGFHRLSFVLHQTGGSVAATFYKNGTLVGSHTFSGVATNFSGGEVWRLGRNAAGNYFTGLIDEVAFFSTLLPLSDLQSHANIGTNVTNPNLSSYFNLNEGDRTALHDMGTALTGNGTTHGASWSTVAAISETLPHEFTPSSRLVTLNPSNTSADQIDFTDQSTIPVSGYARFENTNCFQKGVEILVNGASHVPQIYTDAFGKFSLDVEPGETVRLTPKFEQHTFYPAFWDLTSISAPVAGILFRNQTKRKVVGQLAGNEACRKSVIPAGAIVKVKVATLNGCFEKIQQLPTNGKFTFEGVPPDSVTVAVIEHSNPIIYTFFQNLGGATLDLKMQDDTTDFIYLAPPQVELSPLPTNDCGDAMLNMAASGQTTVKVFEEYDGGVCYLDSAKLTINNGMSDQSQYDTAMTGGQFKLKFKAGSPQIAAPHLKYLQVTAEAHDELASQTLSAVVLGKRARQTTFATTSPEIPTLILRDPPGDQSFSFLETGQKTCQKWSYALASNENTDVKVGVSLGADLTTSVGLGAEVELEIEATADIGIETSTKFNNLITNESETCLTTTERISTSVNDAVVGSAGGADVYMGGAVNYIFGITDDLKFDSDNCAFFLDKGLVVLPDGFATTFIYSEYQITTIVIPNLMTIGDTASAHRWQDIIALNTRLKNEAVFSKNLSFDAAVLYEQSETSEVVKSITHEWKVEFDVQFVNEFGLKVNGIGLSAGLTMGLNTSSTNTNGTATTDTRTVGYTLGDNDLRDNFTVNIKKDKAYGTPVFQTVSGQSACPWEPNTQPREEVQISVDHNVAVNVPENDVAIFQVNLGNTSPSGETGFYYFEVVPESNPHGAQLMVNGVPMEAAILYQIPPNGSLPLIISIGRGQVEYDYTGIRIAARSGCEFDGAIEIGIPREGIDPKFYKEVVVDVHFLEPCSPVNVGSPLQDWVFTNAQGTSMNITVDGYNTSDPDLELIRVQYRRTQGDGAWINIAEIPKADLGDVFEIVPWNLPTSFKDGFYEIRAVTQCFSGALNPGISKVVKGKLERTPPEIIGTPQPADGVLSAGDEISVMFNEEIRCDQLIQADQFDNNNIGLYNTRTGDLIDAVISCSGDKITIVPNVPNQFLENEILRVEVDNIKDLANNPFVHAQWEFVVDRNNLNWVDNVPVYVSKYEEEIKSEVRRIENRCGFAQDFELQGIPDWVRVFPKKGTLSPGQVQVVTFEFDSTLVFGNYMDTVVLHGALGDEPLTVNARVVCHDPDWAVKAADFDYSQNYIVQLDIEGTVSEDIEDIVAAYVGNELRGVAKLRVVSLPGPTTKYEAFLTVYSNQFSGETVNFQIWDASQCLLFGDILESFLFEGDGLHGTLQAPVVLHTNSNILRMIELNSGWNWISFNLAFADNSLNSVLASVENPTGDLIKSQTQFSQNSASLGWVGSLTGIENPKMYQYRTADRDTIHQLGALIDPTTIDIPIAAGWNWIGYIPQKAMTVNEALASLNPLNGDLIKSQTEFAQFLAGFGWVGNLQNMRPTAGYLLKMAEPSVLTYPNTADRPANNLKMEMAEKSKPRSEVWTVDPTKFEHSQTMIAMLKNDGANVTKADFELGAFTQLGECRGAAKAIWIEPLQSHLFFLTMYANQSGEVLNFKTADEKGQISDLKETIFFAADAQTGSVQQPFEFQFDMSAADEDASSMTKEEPFLDVLPNPAIDYATIRFRSPEAGLVNFEITDAAGKLVQAFDFEAIKGMNALLWQEVGNLPKGVYLLKLTASDLILTEKVVVR